MAMSDDHKAALAQGRRESRMVKAYLNALTSRRPGRPVTAESVSSRLDSIERRLESESDPLVRLDLLQDKLDAEGTLKEVGSGAEVSDLEKDFVEVAASFSERKGISYTAWRQAGVPAAALKAAGVPRSRRS